MKKLHTALCRGMMKTTLLLIVLPIGCQHIGSDKELEAALVQALQRDDIATIRNVLTQEPELLNTRLEVKRSVPLLMPDLCGTPVEIAISYLHIDTIKELIRMGCTIEIDHLNEAIWKKQGGDTTSVEDIRIKCIDYLLSLNPELQKNPDFCESLLIRAIESEEPKSLNYLFEKGLSAHTITRKGWNLMDHAVFEHSYEVMPVLKKYGITEHPNVEEGNYPDFDALMELERMRKEEEAADSQEYATRFLPRFHPAANRGNAGFFLTEKKD